MTAVGGITWLNMRFSAIEAQLGNQNAAIRAIGVAQSDEKIKELVKQLLAAQQVALSRQGPLKQTPLLQETKLPILRQRNHPSETAFCSSKSEGSADYSDSSLRSCSGQ
ncbi:MAG: hypothetical protein ABSD72_08890 [Terracidiphilus sp.]